MVKKPTIVVDTREKQPWDWEYDDAFEGVIHKKLVGGDYSIEGLEDVIVIERKKTVDELYINLTKGKKRFVAEFERLRDHKFKIIVIEETCEDALNPDHYYVNKPDPRTGKAINRQSRKMPVAVVTGGLTNIMLKYNVQVVFGGMRAQAMARGILLHAYELHRKGKLFEGEGD